MSFELFSEDKLPVFPQIEIHAPSEIEKASMETIRSELSERKIILPKENEATILRCIHTSADFDYASNLVFSENACQKAKKILSEEKPVIVTDTNMALSGISSPACRKFGIEKVCFMADEDIAEASRKSGLTRAVSSIDKAAFLFKDRPVIFAVGNAPTALVRIRQLHDAGLFSPRFVIGCPVGFVNVVAAKELILESDMDFIVAKGRKGGSTIAAAIVNSILYNISG